MDVSDVLRDRLHEPGGFERMAVLSAIGHAIVLTYLIFGPGRWLHPPQPPPKTIMTISLDGGNGGPNNGGMSPLAARPVQALTPVLPSRPEPIRAPAAKTPEMTLPVPSKTPVKPAAKPAPVVKDAPADAKGRTPTKGAEIREGNAFAETGARGQGFGLSSSGGTGTGSRLDVSDFCCPDYIVFMVEKIRSNWNSKTGSVGLVIVKFTIQRDGTIGDASIEQSSGLSALDINALRAVVSTARLQPLPAQYATLPVHLNFEYKR